MSLKDKKILIGVTGSIAAYKVAILIRLLKKQGAIIKVIMTESAKDFITPLTLSTLSENPVLSKYSNSETGEWHNHVEMALWADIMLIAPASANTIAKAANGICDNLLLAVYLSARCPVYFAPAMDLDMLAHQSTQNNLQKLKNFGNTIIDSTSGLLASGLEGKGRMEEPENILKLIEGGLKKKSDFKGKKVLITAGPTQEAIDPVRFIGNHSSGKMGYAIARAFCLSGAKVELISGPVNIDYNHPNLKIHKVDSALEMEKKAKKLFPKSDISVLAAAVSDYRPKTKAENKIKKKNGKNLNIELVENPDIAFELGQKKTKNQRLIGFALETENLRKNAKEKLIRKNFDLIVMNKANDSDSGFAHDTNRISILDRYNNLTEFELKSKEELAFDILESIRNFKG
ncbi:MAG: bifunctional phosphopantothenoylcysteine decarboxylase/phosphopantothenate--cysteine ligase CoaBC [Cytophagales bacterium]